MCRKYGTILAVSLDESRVYDLLSAGYTAGIPFLDGMKSELMQQKLPLLRS